jgi:hypothetical protein
MARSDTRYSIYPAPKAVEILGSTSPALNEAVECWAALLTRSIADNSRNFSEWYGPDEWQGFHAMHHWAMLAQALKDIKIDPDFPNPGTLIATAVEDAHRLENLGWKWFHAEHLEGQWDAFDALRDTEIAKFLKKLAELDYSHAWALILTVRWFWQHCDEGCDLEKDHWWEFPFRREWKAKQNTEHGSPFLEQQQAKGRRKVKRNRASKGKTGREEG